MRIGALNDYNLPRELSYDAPYDDTTQHNTLMMM